MSGNYKDLLFSRRVAKHTKCIILNHNCNYTSSDSSPLRALTAACLIERSCDTPTLLRDSVTRRDNRGRDRSDCAFPRLSMTVACMTGSYGKEAERRSLEVSSCTWLTPGLNINNQN